MVRATRWLVAFAGFAVLGSNGLADGPPQAGVPQAVPPPKDDDAFRVRVNRAIDRGVEWVLQDQQEGGRFEANSSWSGWAGHNDPMSMRTEAQVHALGESALALYALRACGARFDDPRVVRGFAWLRSHYLSLKSRGFLRNYSVALTLLALEAHHAPPEEPGTQADRYGRSARTARPTPPEDQDWMRELTRWLIAAQATTGGFGYHSPPRGWEDHSNTQFSLLALKAARRCGIDVPQAVWGKSLKRLLSCQEKNGPPVARREETGKTEGPYGPPSRSMPQDHARGWGYKDRGIATGSMTAGGVSSLVICRSELLGKPGYDAATDGEAEQGIWDGLAWLDLHFTVRENPGPQFAPMAREIWQYYYLYGLERAGVLSGVRWLGSHDWYLEGASYLLGEQARDGGWSQDPSTMFGDVPLPPGRGRPFEDGSIRRCSTLLDTCFALLFLKRATFRVPRGGVATVPADQGLDLTDAHALDDRDFRDLFDMVFHRYVAADTASRVARSREFVQLGLRAIPLLILRLDDAEEGPRAAAIAVLNRTTGLTHGFDTAGPEEARTSAIRAWEEWWFSKCKKLVADVEAGRFREE